MFTENVYIWDNGYPAESCEMVLHQQKKHQKSLSVLTAIFQWTWVSWYQNVSILDLLDLTMMEVVVTTGTCKAPVVSSPQTEQHAVFTGRMPFLSPN